MTNKPNIQVSVPDEDGQANSSGIVMLVTKAPRPGVPHPIAVFKVKVTSPENDQPVTGVVVYVSYSIIGQVDQPRPMFGSPKKTDVNGEVSFECPVPNDVLRRTNFDIECNGAKVICGLLPPKTPPATPLRIVRAEPIAAPEPVITVTDVISGPVDLGDEPQAVFVPPNIPPARPPGKNDDSLRSTNLGLPVIEDPMQTVQSETSGVVVAPMADPHLGDTMPQVTGSDSGEFLEPESDTPDKAPTELESLLSEAFAKIEELQRQFESSIQDEVELQRQLQAAFKALFDFLAETEAVFVKYQADIDQETREMRDIKRTFDQLLESVDVKALAHMETMAKKAFEFDQSGTQLFERLKIELEALHRQMLERTNAAIARAQSEAIAAIEEAGQKERAAMVDVGDEQKRQIVEAAPLLPYPPLEPPTAQTLVRETKVMKRQTRPSLFQIFKRQRTPIKVLAYALITGTGIIILNQILNFIAK